MPASPLEKTILITGCSTGIGRAAAEQLAARGHRICATARRPESVDDLRNWAATHHDRVRVDKLDVTDPQTGKTVVDTLRKDWGRIDALVNNAGFGQPGAVEDVTPDRWRRQFEVNLFGLIELTQQVLPAMRDARAGRIINVSSVVGHVTIPCMGAYCASKHALNAVSNALRMELKRWNIHVVQIEPGPVATDFRQNVERNVDDTASADQSAYTKAYAILSDNPAALQQRGAASADDVARSIQRAVEASRPRTRYRITPIARFVPALTFLLGDRLTDRFILRTYGLRPFAAGQGRRP